MRFRDLNWMDVERYLQTDNRIILITGATEQHSYLSLVTDVRIPEKIADAVCARDNVMIAPAISFGVGTQFMDFPGTISIAQSTFDAMLTDVVQSLFRQGFTNFLILNGHRCNRFPETLTYLVEEGYTQIVWFDWWNADAVRKFEAQHDLRVAHANWSENFAFNRIAPIPQHQLHRVVTDKLPQDMMLREKVGDGNLGGQYQIDDRLMFQLLDKIVDEVAQLLLDMRH